MCCCSCDGAKPGRNYFTDFVKAAPNDTLILTLACGKYRFNDLDLGEIGGLPRILDMGQCNDACSAIKAVSILLTLLYLGIKNIRLGPTLPAFVSPNILNFLVENFGIAPTTTAEEDIKSILK
jgi:hydroxylamine reductase